MLRNRSGACFLAATLAVAASPAAAAPAILPADGAPPVVLVQGDGTPAFERSWDRQTRFAIQDALVWTGDYETRLDGSIGPTTRKAIRAFQRRHGFEPTGYLTRPQFDALMEARRAAKDAVGFRVIEDPEAGIRVGIPADLVSRSHRENTSVVYRPQDRSKITSLALISMPGDRSALPALFDTLTRPDLVEPDAYTLLKDDYFVVSDEKDGTVTYTYVRAAGGALKGFTLAWPERRMDTFAPIATAMFNSFEPIPGVLD